MTMTPLRNFWRSLFGPGDRQPEVIPVRTTPRPAQAMGAVLEVSPDDPLVIYFEVNPNVVEVESLDMASPALNALKAAGIRLAVPLVSQGELIGLLSMGPRLSEQDFSSDDRVLLNNLATQAAPAVRVAQLVRQQQIDAQQRERLEQELRVARFIQESLLPQQMPVLEGWQIAALYKPARAVGGDFYDFLPLPDQRLGLVIGDATDKGVPAALVMATTRAILRSAAQQLASPGEILGRANDLLYPDMPPNMFVTCMYAILDPATGRLQYANAGHNLPFRRSDGRVNELWATGMPLGLMPDMSYEEKETILAPGESVLFYSDGLVEAHNAQREMLGSPRLSSLMGQPHSARELVDFLIEELAKFTGADWEQEDDVTLVTLERERRPSPLTPLPERERGIGAEGDDGGWKTLAKFSLASEAGNERIAMKEVAKAVEQLRLPAARVENLQTAVAEATMNAMEYGNNHQPELPVEFEVRATKSALSVRITDQGRGGQIPEPQTPNLEAKLQGLQSPRGWGLFLIKSLVDEMYLSHDDAHHMIELVMNLEGREPG